METRTATKEVPRLFAVETDYGQVCRKQRLQLEVARRARAARLEEEARQAALQQPWACDRLQVHAEEVRRSSA